MLEKFERVAQSTGFRDPGAAAPRLIWRWREADID
jgi:hypothetical protein